MKRIYFASPLFCVGEMEFNKIIVDILEKHGYEVFLPQRDGILAAQLEGLTSQQKVSKVFEKDMGELKKSDLLVFVLDGRVPDEGACVELGAAYSLGKKCYGIRTDMRALEEGLPVNPLIMGCFTHVFENSDFNLLKKEIELYLDQNEL